MLSPLALSRPDLVAFQRFLQDPTTQYRDAEALLSTAGQDKWATALQLAHPVVPLRQMHTAGDTHRGFWVNVAGCLGAVLQKRVVHHEQAPLTLRLFLTVPQTTTPDLPGAYMPAQQPEVIAAWLNHAAQAFQSWDPAQQTRAHSQAALSNRLSGVSWSLLSGRAPAESLLLASDLA